MAAPPQPGRDRRIFGRLGMEHLPVHVAISDEGDVSIDVMDLIDLSMTGAGIHADRPVHSGALVVMRIDPDDRHGILMLPGHTLYCRPLDGDDGRWFIGVAFGTLASDTHSRLARWLFVQHHRRSIGHDRRLVATAPAG